MKLPIFQIVIACLLLSAGAAAQNKGKIAVQAVEKYEQLSYSEAIELYKQGDADAETIEHLANSYRLSGDSWNAARWYALLMKENTRPINYLYYAQALQRNADYEKARTYFLKYNQAVGYSLNPDKRAQQQLKAIDHLRSFQLTADVELRNEWNINSEKLDFSPVFYKNGIVFVSNRSIGKAEKDAWTGDNYTSLYFVPAGEFGAVGDSEPFSFGTATAEFHDGPLSFNPSGELAFLTKNKEVKGKKRAGKQEWNLKIFTTSRSGEGWTAPLLVDLGCEISNDAHPALSPDGMQLFFASDRPGGYGGMDLYVARFRGGRWSYPINLGPEINTAGNEVFPFITKEGTLLFASDGWGGLGGLDLFFAEKTGEMAFGQAANLGAPFNSPQDDFGLILTPSGKEGYFASSREGGRGKDDIYHFSAQVPILWSENLIHLFDLQGNADNFFSKQPGEN